jgi:hypothetical protein
MTVAGSSEKETPDLAPSIGREHAPMILRERHGRNATSSNWSGYAVTGANGSVSDVKGSWIVPPAPPQALVCPSSGIQYASFWVGIDGYDTNTVEQIGTDSDCQNGSAVYYAWYEFYPHYPVNLPLAIHPGDTISAEVSYSGGKFTVWIEDITTGKTWMGSQKMPDAKRASAEWIVEASGGQPLANFGSVTFGSFSLPCEATVTTLGGTSDLIGSAPLASSLVEITMVASNGTTMSQPSGISQDETSFTATWKYAGP